MFCLLFLFFFLFFFSHFFVSFFLDLGHCGDVARLDVVLELGDLQKNIFFLEKYANYFLFCVKLFHLLAQFVDGDLLVLYHAHELQLVDAVADRDQLGCFEKGKKIEFRQFFLNK